MVADRARLTYTPARQYREVVSQQGRVTLEADVNEAGRISSESTRQNALDFVGPVGTPDDGYAVSVTGGGTELSIGPGTMYVGGLRLQLPATVQQSAQPDWKDTATDPLWVPPGDGALTASLALLAIEQEITAVEDAALREVALGGPDSAARTRILQRFPLVSGAATNCDSAAGQIATFWAARGRTYNAAAAALEPRSRLKVTALSTPPAASPCDPPSQSGYLGADNQLIRVQISAYNPATQTGRLLWGWHNASTLYRCTPKSATTVELARRPIAPEFAPATNQAVQLLMPAADLGEGAIASALVGHVATLMAPYQPDTRMVTLPAAMPAPYQTPPANLPLFLRLWQEDKPFTLGTAVELTGTGLAVTITASTGNVVSVGDYWSIAVRPQTPNAVYPERLLAAPQPPDGPREWLCPLAVVRRTGRTWESLDDCRLPFDNLVELTARQPGGGDSCCCITVKPEQAKELQDIIDKLAAEDAAGVVVRFSPGIYLLPKPLVIIKRHRGLVLESCTGARVQIRAAKESPDFAQGLVLMQQATEVTLRGLEFLVPFVQAPSDLIVQRLKELNLGAIDMGVGVHMLGNPIGAPVSAAASRDILIERCDFVFTPAEQAFGAAILGREQLIGLQVRGCRFTVQIKEGTAAPLAAGLLIVPTEEPTQNYRTSPQPVSLAVEGNEFSNLTFGTLIAGLAGDIAARGNAADDCFCPIAVMTLMPFVARWRDLIKQQIPGVTTADPGFSQTKGFNDNFINDVRVTLMMEIAPLIPAMAKPTPPGEQTVQAPMRLDVAGNRLMSRAAAGFALQATGPSLYVWDIAVGRFGLVTVTDNTCSNQSLQAPTMMVMMADRMSITGNLITNEVAEPDGANVTRMALIVVPGGRVESKAQKVEINLMAVTGNTMVGRSNLQFWIRKEWANRLPAGMPPIAAWDFFNTEV
jgi:hypothetical protein